MKIELLLPVKDIFITQPFGVNYLDFYTKLGMKGHNGVDFRARRGCTITSSHEGVIQFAGEDGDGGISVIIWNDKLLYKTIYYHLLEVAPKIQKGIRIGAGEIIGKADNTGKYTTGDHLHFGMKMTDTDGNTIDTGNGFGGAVDPAPYFENRYGKNWMKPAAFHRYGRKQDWFAEFKTRFKNAWLHKQLNKYGMLNKIYDTEFINALVYGGWGFDEVMNPSLYYNWAYLKKSEFLEGKKPFE